MTNTYLHHCLKNEVLARWPDSAMPIRVYIAPFTWYEKRKQQQALLYKQMILDSLNTWRDISQGLVKFLVVDTLNQSQIDFRWRRVDRNSLGHCEYEIDAHGRLFSAEIQIGISDGVLHSAYQDTGEVRHTILHEIGHALGLTGHSDHPDDIMYVPHQYGVYRLSQRDAETLRWLYRLPIGFNYKAVGGKYDLKPGYTLNDVIDAIEKKMPVSASKAPTGFSKLIHPNNPQTQDQSDKLERHHQILSQMGRFHLTTQNIQVDPQKHAELTRIQIQQQRKNWLPPL